MVRKFGIRRPALGLTQRRRLIDRKFRQNWRSYLFQSALTMLALLIILLVIDVVLQAAIVVAIASTAFIVFVAPHSNAASPRRVVGGHMVSVIVGTFFSMTFLAPELGDLVSTSQSVRDLFAVLSVGLSMLLMAVTDSEHPPAAGTALGLVITGWTPSAVLFVVLGSVILSVIHLLLRPYLKNLL
ncbi:MAG: HPP family protein [Chloroflexota bacterium]|nr:HPP family protein [Chloroflexota bacterium]